MSLTRFGNFAVDWERVYALRVIAKDFNETEAAKVAVWAALPGAKPGDPVITLEDEQAKAAWGLVARDPRFKVINTLAIDMSRLCAVDRHPRGTSSTITFA